VDMVVFGVDFKIAFLLWLIFLSHSSQLLLLGIFNMLTYYIKSRYGGQHANANHGIAFGVISMKVTYVSF